jgi:hypothetical protein
MKRQRAILLMTIAATLLLSAACSKTGNDALTALKKVHAATQSGVTYDPYSQLVIEAQAAVNEHSSKLPDGELKSELKSALDAYNDAKWAWEISRQSPASNGRDSFILAAGLQDMNDLSSERKSQTRARDLLKKYSVTSGDESVGELALISTNDVLQAIWRVAEKHVNRASELL